MIAIVALICAAWGCTCALLVSEYEIRINVLRPWQRRGVWLVLWLAGDILILRGLHP